MDAAVVDAADRWIGRAMDATAYADLVASVLARRAALAAAPTVDPDPPADEVTELHSWRGSTLTSSVAGGVRTEANGGATYGPSSYGFLTATGEENLPPRPAGRHRGAREPETAPVRIDVRGRLASVRPWLGEANG
jgi:hypothetical protein